MCGRFGLFTDLAELVELLGFELGMPSDAYTPRWNIAPTAQIFVITEADGERIGSMMRWGLIPRWAKPHNAFKRLMFNARSETIAERRTFRDSFMTRRCLVPANGFFEWRRDGTRNKTPMWVSASETPIITFAGIWSVWRGPDGLVESCSIITTSSNALMAPIHNRMPVILDDDWAAIWLDDAADQPVLLEALKPREWETMRAQEAHPDVGSPRIDGAHLLDPQSKLF